MKPHVICHMLSPLDGRLLLDAWAPKESSLRKAVLDEYQELHKKFEADAWLAGTTTMEDFASDKAPTVASVGAQAAARPARPWHVADAQARHFAIAIDRHARLHWDKPTADEGHVVVVLGSDVPDSHLSELISSGVSYLVMPAREIDLDAMLTQLHDRLHIQSLLLEGGAQMNGAFLKAGLVDEISLILCPAIDGKTGGATIFEAGEESVGPTTSLKLSEATPLDSGAVHLRYAVSKQN